MLAAWVSAFAEGAPRVVLRDWGIYGASGHHDVADPTTTSGERRITDDPRLLQQTTQICAKLGTMFGLAFELQGSLAPGVEVDIDHPPMRNHLGIMQSRDRIFPDVTPGLAHWSGWTFKDPQKLLPGSWKFSILIGGQVALAKSFHVDVDCNTPVA